MASLLSSLKILDFSTLLPGPFATMMLADMGAEVVRVESPDRPDMVRLLPPYDGDISAWHAVLNRNKRSLALDLKRPQAIDVVKRLVGQGGFDIAIEQFRPGVMDRLGIGYEALRATNPSVIYCAITSYGQTGPYRNRAGHDSNFLALSGILSYSGRKESGPPPIGIQVADIGGGSFGAIVGLLAAVIYRQATGEGQLVDISMFDLMVAWQSHIAGHVLIAGELPAPEAMALNGGRVYDYYRTQDGRWLSVAGLEPKFWEGFCAAIGRPDLLHDGLSLEPAVQSRVKSEVAAVLVSRSLAAWMEVFTRLDVCVEPVLTLPEMLAHPQTQARGLIVDVPKPDGSFQRQVGQGIKFSAGQSDYQQIGPKLGADTDAVLTAAGYTATEIESMRTEQVFG
jgi:crotonobetainyl-CoA:carnitine CoA-transferase CaiB-like acyl-CoA transferase